jgi:hypothetical protein
VKELYHLTEVDLLAARRDAWILPYQLPAVGEIASSITLPQRRLVPIDHLYKATQFVTALHNAHIGAKQVSYQRTFKRCIRGVQGH